MHVVLIEPEIPQNTGNIARTCAALQAELHLIEPLGFSLADRYLKRAGLDYWDLVTLHLHPDLDDFMARADPECTYYFTTKARQRHTDIIYPETVYLMFGKESAGLPEELLLAHPAQCLRIPMLAAVRSLNLSNAAAVAAYEYCRQLDYPGLSSGGNLHRHSWPPTE